MVWVVSRFGLKAPPGISSSCISPLTSSGQRSRALWASQPQKSATLSRQPGGKPRRFIRTCGGIGEREKKKNLTHLPRSGKSKGNKDNFRVLQQGWTFLLRTVLFEMSAVLQLVKIFFTFQNNRRFIAMFTKVSRLSLP